MILPASEQNSAARESYEVFIVFDVPCNVPQANKSNIVKWLVCIMAIVALLSNTKSTGLVKLLPRIRSFILTHANIFHVEINHTGEVPDALTLIARSAPDVLVINGGDGTVQAVLTSLMHDQPFIAQKSPPLAILSNGKKSAIADDYTTTGKPMQALERISMLVKHGMLEKHLIQRSLIALDDGKRHRSVIGTNVELRCTHQPMQIILCKNEIIKHCFAFVDISTSTVKIDGSLHFVGVEPGWLAKIKARLSRRHTLTMNGVHERHSDEIRFEGNTPGAKLDGESFEAAAGSALKLRSTPSCTFVKLAA